MVAARSALYCCSALWEEVAHRVISWQRTISIAFGAKRTLSRIASAPVRLSGAVYLFGLGVSQLVIRTGLAFTFVIPRINE